MAKKSKTQRAKASAARQARKAQVAELEAQGVSVAEIEAKKAQEIKKQQEAKKAEQKKAKPKKQRFKFLKEVKAELKRVTWPTRPEVLRWTGVVVAALVFFGVFVAVLDNLIVTPLMVALSGIGAGL